MMKGANFWALLFALTLFMLGIDSAFSTLEATTTVLHDTKFGHSISRKLAALFLCLVGAACSAVFCFNWGFTFFDVVDHYLNVYLMLFLGLLECMACGWVYEAGQVIETVGKAPVFFLIGGYWISLVVIGILTFLLLPDRFWIGIIVFAVVQIPVALISWKLSKLSYIEWHNTVAMSGVKKLSHAMTHLSRKDPKGERERWEYVFDTWWGISIKYICPFLLWILLVSSTGLDLKKNYGGYHVLWQMLGLCIPIIGILIFIVSLFICTKKDPFNPELEKAFDQVELAEREQEIKGNQVAPEPEAVAVREGG